MYKKFQFILTVIPILLQVGCGRGASTDKTFPEFTAERLGAFCGRQFKPVTQPSLNKARWWSKEDSGGIQLYVESDFGRVDRMFASIIEGAPKESTNSDGRLNAQYVRWDDLNLLVTYFETTNMNIVPQGMRVPGVKVSVLYGRK